MSENIYTAELDKSGRILVPVMLRRQLDMSPGDKISFSFDGEDVRLVTHKMALKKLKEIGKKVKQEFYQGKSVVDELIRERREEAAREDD